MPQILWLKSGVSSLWLKASELSFKLYNTVWLYAFIRNLTCDLKLCEFEIVAAYTCVGFSNYSKFDHDFYLITIQFYGMILNCESFQISLFV